MENKIYCEVYRIKTYPSNMVVELRYEDKEGDYNFISIDVDMDYIRNSDFLRNYNDYEEANADILEDIILTVEDNLPDNFELGEGEENNLYIPCKWEVEQEELEND